MNRIPIFNIVLGEADGIQVMSLVSSPAVEVDFIRFAKENEHISFSVDEERHMVFGCALRADYPIYRFSPTRGEYYVLFSRETINELYEKFMTSGCVSNVNLEHSKDTDGVILIQSFIKDTDKGINPIGFEDVADGSWFVQYKVDNPDVWKSIKDGNYNGFSIEGTFELEPSEFSEQKDEIEVLIDEIL